MGQERVYYPHLVIKVSYHMTNSNPKQPALTSYYYPAMYYMGDKRQTYINFVDNIAKEFGIQIDVHADANESDINKKGATLVIKDSTPGGKFPSHNTQIRMKPGDYKALKFNMGNGISICVKCGLYKIAEEHVIEGEKAYRENREPEFLSMLCSMKPIIDEYERLKKYGSPYQIIVYKDKHRKEIGFYKQYYEKVGTLGLTPGIDNEKYNEML